MMNLPCNRSFALLASGMVALLTACGSNSSLGDGGDRSGTGGAGGTTQTGGNSGSGGNPGTGGKVGSGGSPGTDGSVGSGGSPGTGDAALDTENTDGSIALDACSSAIDTAPFIAQARKASCSSLRNSLLILDCSMILWQVRGNCSDASYSYVLFGTTVDDVLCSYSDSIAGPRSVSNSAICASLFPPSSSGG
jgi:hypothetical protein